MKPCKFCNPEIKAGAKTTVDPVVDDENVMICVVGHTPIGNRMKKGSVQIYFKRTRELISAALDKCPVCGQLLYNEQQ